MTMKLIVITLVILLVVLITVYIVRRVTDHEQPQTSKLQAVQASSTAIRPKDGSGKSVDWFVVFKMPAKVCTAGITDCDTCDKGCSGCPNSKCPNWTAKRAGGECYYYADNNNPSLQYYTDLGYGCLNEPNNPLSHTMSQINLKGSNYILWNDQGVTKSCSGPKAHSKGAVCYNAQGGFVLNTSTPHWPNADGLPVGCQEVDNSSYAQHMFCFSLSASGIQKWMAGAQTAGLCVTESNVVPVKNFPVTDTMPPVVLKTLGGVSITAMFKGRDTYSPWSLVSATLGTDIEVASWTADSAGGKSGWGNDKYYKNSKEKLSQIIRADTSTGCFPTLYSYSHAKWGISVKPSWVIFGSMNQQESQATRGGDFYAIKNPALWKSLHAMVGAKEDVERR